MQVAAHFVQIATAGGDLFGLLAQGADQLQQVAAQTVERGLDIDDFANLRVDPRVPAEVAFGPCRQGRYQLPEGAGELALQAVDGQGDEQDQRDDRALDQPHLALDAPMFGAHRRLQLGQRLLHGGDFARAAVVQLAALADQFAGALQLGRVTFGQAGQFALERDAAVFGLLLVRRTVEFE